MLFNSFEFLIGFLPVTILVYFLLNKWNLTTMAKGWLFVASLFFYSWWNPIYLPLILGSMGLNYGLGRKLGQLEGKAKKALLTLGIAINLGALGYFKYADFFIENINVLVQSDFNLLNVALPLAISFFTFQQIAYLVDSYQGETKEYGFFNYGLFVTFFPQLIAGPIVHHSEMMGQFTEEKNKLVNYDNLIKGIYIFFIGLAKKIIIADTFANPANTGYEYSQFLSMPEGWITSLSYAFQLYFDFSGYSDMAIGVGLMFNIKLPLNFHSPYRALDIQDFWRRWHITLSRFLRDYLYIPLGGNRGGETKTLRNLVLTFLLGGLWHGAGWTFVIWGLMHGVGLVIHRLWSKTGISLPKILGWIITFNFVNVAWVFFRAPTFADASNILKAMFGLGTNRNFNINIITEPHSLPLILLGIILLFGPNTMELGERFKPNKKHLVYVTGLILVGFLFMNSITSSDFLYFDF